MERIWSDSWVWNVILNEAQCMSISNYSNVKLMLNTEINFLINNIERHFGITRMEALEAANSQEKWCALVLTFEYCLLNCFCAHYMNNFQLMLKHIQNSSESTFWLCFISFVVLILRNKISLLYSIGLNMIYEFEISFL